MSVKKRNRDTGKFEMGGPKGRRKKQPTQVHPFRMEMVMGPTGKTKMVKVPL